MRCTRAQLHQDTRSHLVGRQEVLLHGRTRQGARELVAVQHAKIRESQRQLSVGTDAVGEHQTVPGAVHGLTKNTHAHAKRGSHQCNGDTSRQIGHSLQPTPLSTHPPHAHTSTREFEGGMGTVQRKNESPMAPTLHLRATHLQAEALVLNLKREHVFQVVVVVATDAPQIQVEHVRGHHLSVAGRSRDGVGGVGENVRVIHNTCHTFAPEPFPSPLKHASTSCNNLLALAVLALDVPNQLVVDVGTSGKEEARAGRQGVEEEQLVLLTQHTVVTLQSIRRGGGEAG